MLLPKRIFSGFYKGGHVQGIAVDQKRGFMYYSFTTELIKTDLRGNVVGTVRNLAGHLGCITFDAERNLLYGSLELKHDIIGRDIMDVTGIALSQEDAFYLVCFDVEKIDRIDMDAETDGVMQAVYLRNVAQDYAAVDPVSGQPHRYGCSGIDGVALGPVFGKKPDSEPKIMIAYGIYSDTQRQDNDYQVLLQFDRSVIEQYAKPLNQLKPHHSGPETYEQQYFFLTGNTTYGIQNLEYDPYSRCWFVAVYKGSKERYCNFKLYAIDGTVAPVVESLAGRMEQGLVLSSAKLGQWDRQADAWGSDFSYGATGIASLGDGEFYFSENGYDKEKKLFYTYVQKYRLTPKTPELFTVTDP